MLENREHAAIDITLILWNIPLVEVHILIGVWLLEKFHVFFDIVVSEPWQNAPAHVQRISSSGSAHFCHSSSRSKPPISSPLIATPHRPMASTWEILILKNSQDEALSPVHKPANLSCGETSSPNDEVALILSALQFIEAMIGRFMEIVCILHTLMAGVSVGGTLERKSSVMRNRKGKLVIPSGVTNSRCCHILPDHLQSHIKEILILCSPPFTYLFST